MLVIGIDVAILLLMGIACVCVSVLFALHAPLEREAGWASIISTAITAVTLVFTYIVMAGVLDWIISL